MKKQTAQFDKLSTVSSLKEKKTFDCDADHNCYGWWSYPSNGHGQKLLNDRLVIYNIGSTYEQKVVPPLAAMVSSIQVLKKETSA